MGSDFLSFLNIRRVFFQNFFRIIIIMVISVALFSIYYIFSIKTYEIKSLVKIDYSQKNNASIETSLFSSNDDTSLEEQMLIYKSRSNLIEIVDNLKLDIMVNSAPILFSSSELNLHPSSNYLFNYDDSIKNFIIQMEPDKFIVYDDEKQILIGQYEEIYNIDQLTIGVMDYIDNSESLTLSLMPKELAVEYYLKNTLKLSKVATERDFFAQGSLIEVSYISSNRDLAKKIVNEANAIFIANSVKSNSQEAKRSIAFLDDQIDLLKNNLEKQENEANAFKEANTSLDIEAESLALVEQYQKLTSEINKTEVALADAFVIYKNNNPRIVGLKSQLSELKEQELNLQKNISLLPRQQQIFIELTREIEVNRLILDLLQQKKIEFSLLEASTLGNVSIIDNAYVSSKVTPKGMVGLITFLIFGGFFSIVYSFIRSAYYMPINLPSDITDELPEFNITGIIKGTTGNFSVIEDENFEQTNTLVTNISYDSFDKKECSTILLTGPSSGVGKTTTTLLIAKCLASRDKKVLVLDCDFRRGDINKNLNIDLLEDTSFLKDTSNNEDYKIDDNLYFIPRPRKQALSSLRIFESIEFRIFIDKKKEFFDYIIIDTPPCLAITDSLVLSRLCDKRYLVARHSITKIGEIKASINSFESIGLPLDGCIYNAITKPKGVSYYDYSSYSYYGYQYYNYDPYTSDDAGK